MEFLKSVCDPINQHNAGENPDKFMQKKKDEPGQIEFIETDKIGLPRYYNKYCPFEEKQCCQSASNSGKTADTFEDLIVYLKIKERSKEQYEIIGDAGRFLKARTSNSPMIKAVVIKQIPEPAARIRLLTEKIRSKNLSLVQCIIFNDEIERICNEKESNQKKFEVCELIDYACGTSSGSSFKRARIDVNHYVEELKNLKIIGNSNSQSDIELISESFELLEKAEERKRKDPEAKAVLGGVNYAIVSDFRDIYLGGKCGKTKPMTIYGFFKKYYCESDKQTKNKETYSSNKSVDSIFYRLERNTDQLNLLKKNVGYTEFHRQMVNLITRNPEYLDLIKSLRNLLNNILKQNKKSSSSILEVRDDYSILLGKSNK